MPTLGMGERASIARAKRASIRARIDTHSARHDEILSRAEVAATRYGQVVEADDAETRAMEKELNEMSNFSDEVDAMATKTGDTTKKSGGL